MAGHLLALEDLSGVLALAGRAQRAVRNRNPVTGPQAGKIVPFDGPGKALADAGAADIDELARNEMVRGKFGADVDQGIF